jgi:SH3-like domain-containing protein
MSAAVLEPEVAAPLVVNLPTPQANTTPAPNPPPATQSNGAPQIAAPIVVVNAVLVNVRAGPSTNNSILKVAERGDQYNVIGRLPDSSWWQICCVDGQEGWINHEFVDSDGPVESVPVIAQVAQLAAPQSNAGQSAQPTATNAALATAPPDNNGAFEFDLALTEQFPDTNVMHVFLYVFDNNGALAGYSLRATRNGVELPIQAAASFGPQPGLTWPIADSRQRFQNYKVEFPGEPSGGTWEVQLVKDGKPVGPPARFQLKDNDPNRELYVRYQKK